MKTELLYLSEPDRRACEARILAIEPRQEGLGLIVDQTPAYPKGGGQPSDRGKVRGPLGLLEFDLVSRDPSGAIIHFGRSVKGRFAVGDRVQIEIDSLSRSISSRLHTAGELICAAVAKIGPDWAVGAASHVPGQARVAFHVTTTPPELTLFRDDLLRHLNALVDAGHPVRTIFVDAPEKLAELCPAEAMKAFPAWPVRMVSPAPAFWRPCLGAHCENTAEVGPIHLQKIRIRDGELSISYSVEGAA